MSLIIQFLTATAWPMTPPAPYSLFHIGLTAAGISAAAAAAWKLAKSSINRDSSGMGCLFICGVILAVSEIYKQLFLYWIVNQGTYDWWYFPFQLCSVPMYLCLLLPLISRVFHRKFQRVVCTFIQDFGLLGGLLALAEPSGLMHPYWTLTLHGFCWHFLLIFAGLFCGFRGLSYRKWKDFPRVIPLFLCCCCLATLINILARPQGRADMFYISPYYPNGQIVFHQIALRTGIFAGNLIYLAAVLAGAALFHGAISLAAKAFEDSCKQPPPPGL